MVSSLQKRTSPKRRKTSKHAPNPEHCYRFEPASNPDGANKYKARLINAGFLNTNLACTEAPDDSLPKPKPEVKRKPKSVTTPKPKFKKQKQSSCWPIIPGPKSSNKSN